MPYTIESLQTMADALSVALGQPLSDQRFWTDDELKRYVREALRTWNCYTTYWRDRRSFVTAIGQTRYDLRDPITPAVTPLLNVAVDPASIVNDLQYALLEAYFPFGVYTSIFPTTEMYTSEQINTAVLQAVAQWNFDTGLVVQQEPVAAVPVAPSTKVDLNEDVCDIRHAQINVFAADGISDGRYSLRRQDEFDSTTWQGPRALVTAGTPYAYSFLLTNSQPALRLIPPASLVGELETVSIRSSSFPPLDWQWAVKWLALYFLLTQDAQCRDYFRAEYCKKRYQDSLLAARLYPTALQTYIQEQPLAATTTASDLDCWQPGWQNQFGLPTDIIWHGWNLCELTPTPDAIYSVALEMAIAAPTDTAPLQLAQEHKQIILDYAKHLALFKVGGAEWQATMAHYERFVDACIEYNSKLLIEAKNFWVMRDRAARDANQRYQRRMDPADAAMIVGGSN